MKGVNVISRRSEEEATLVDVISCELYNFVFSRMQLDVLRNLREKLQVFHDGEVPISLLYNLQRALQLRIRSGRQIFQDLNPKH